MVVADDAWASLLADLPHVLFPEWDDDEELLWPENGDSLQVHDTRTGQQIVFWAEDKGLDIRVTVPADETAAARLRTVLESQRTNSFAMVRDYESGRMVPLEEPLWSPVEIRAGGDRAVDENRAHCADYAREWRTGWRHGADSRNEVAAAIVAVLRDGLGTTPEQLRVTSYNDRGPTTTQRMGGVASSRPTSSGLPARCSGWDEFVTRFEWILTTLPWLGNVILSVRGKSTQDAQFMQFCNTGGNVDTECILWDQAGLELHELDRRMGALGWRWAPDHLGSREDPVWLGPPSGRQTRHPAMSDLAVLTMTTLRDVAGVEDPSGLVFEAFSNARGVDDMSYVGAELGIDAG